MNVSLSLGKENLIPSKKSPGTLFFSLGEENKIFLDYIEDNQEKRASFSLSGDNFLRKMKMKPLLGVLLLAIILPFRLLEFPLLILLI